MALEIAKRQPKQHEATRIVRPTGGNRINARALRGSNVYTEQVWRKDVILVGKGWGSEELSRGGGLAIEAAWRAFRPLDVSGRQKMMKTRSKPPGRAG
jgi:hypothetical protein